MFLAVIFTIFVIILGGLLITRRKSNLPGPKGVPFFGNLLQFASNIERFDQWLVELFEEHGDTFSLQMTGKPEFVFTTNPENVEHILKTKFTNYEKGPFFHSIFQDLLGNGIFNADGEDWKPQRKITSNMFNVKNFKDGMLGTFVLHSKTALDIIEKNKNDIDVSDLYYRYTLDSICEIAFGQNIHSLENPKVEFAEVWDKSNSLIVERAWAFSLFLRKFSPAEKEISRSIEVMNKFAQNILDTRKKEDFETLSKRADLLSLFMSKKHVDGTEFSDIYLRDMILNMIIAGRDTTAQSLAWTCYLLAQHKEVREKIIEEVDNVLGDADPDYESLKELTYLQAVITESLRLYPSVPRDPHTSSVDDVLPTGHKVAAGSFVFYCPYAMGRSKELWGEDASTFDPERFVRDPKQANNAFKFTAFQGGPRTCLGQNMAYLEEKTMLSMIFQRYDIHLIEGQKVEIQMSATLPMKRGLRLQFIPRNSRKINFC